jgi:hypothetical protein
LIIEKRKRAPVAVPGSLLIVQNTSQQRPKHPVSVCPDNALALVAVHEHVSSVFGTPVTVSPTVTWFYGKEISTINQELPTTSTETECTENRVKSKHVVTANVSGYYKCTMQFPGASSIIADARYFFLICKLIRF